MGLESSGDNSEAAAHFSQRFTQRYKDVLVSQAASLAKRKEHQGRELGGRGDPCVTLRQGTATHVWRDYEMQAGLRGQCRSRAEI